MRAAVSHSGWLKNGPSEKGKLETTMKKITTAVLGLSLMLGTAAFAAQTADKKVDQKPATAADTTTVKKHKKHKKSAAKSSNTAIAPATTPPTAK
jgi:hypothetical protein